MSNYFKELREYVQDNPNNYWFKAKLYGWGWTPVRWEGWLTIGIFIMLALLLSFNIKQNSTPTDVIWTFFVPLALLVVALITVCYKKGEKPRWQWGPPKK